mgnify:CR=1 FL=1
MLTRGEIHQPQENVGQVIRFADGSSGRVYRETTVDHPVPLDPCVLVVAFRLRAVRGRGHTAFEWESLLNTPLFVGFPGFVSKLWLAHDGHGTYRGLEGASPTVGRPGHLETVTEHRLEMVCVAGLLACSLMRGQRGAVQKFLPRLEEFVMHAREAEPDVGELLELAAAQLERNGTPRELHRVLELALAQWRLIGDEVRVNAIHEQLLLLRARL